MRDRAAAVRVTGPLSAYAAEFHGWLVGAAYTSSSASAHLRLMAQLSRWIEVEGLSPSVLSDKLLATFLAVNRSQGHRFPKSERGVEPLIGFLRSIGVAPVPAVAELSPRDALLGRFSRYLAHERGLGEATIAGQVHAARLFLDSVGDRPMGLLDPSCVHRFVVGESRHRSASSTMCLVTGLRAFLRFLHVEGITQDSLVGAVPTVSGWTGTWIPRGVDPDVVGRIVASCDCTVAQGRRDYAVLMVLSRLGLRVGEVAALDVADIDWRNGELMVRGKSRRIERLPVPSDVGVALADYVAGGRPSAEDGALFVRVLAPHRRLSPGGLIVIVKTACVRAGVEPVAAHRLRHTVASQLLGQGAGLAEIGQLLRHRSPASTAIYAKVDLDRLRHLARPWPGVS